MSRISIGLLIGAFFFMAVAGGATYWYGWQQQRQPETVRVERISITQEVEFKGHVTAKQTAQLGFELAGIVKNVGIAVGDTVEAGQELAQLDIQATKFEVAKAFAERVSQQEKSRLALETAKNTVEKTNRENALIVEEQKQAIRNTKQELDQAKEVWQQTERERGPDSATTKTAYSDFLTATTAYNAAQKALKTAEETAAKSNQAVADALRTAQASYDATRQASGAVAGLSALRAQEEVTRVRLSKDTLRAPFGGTITAKTIEPGEVVVAGQPLITLQTTSTTEISADVDELDIPKIAIGAPAKITVDAYPQLQWSATVTSIDPAGVIDTDDDVTYQVKLQLPQTDTRLWPALTTQAIIRTGERHNVLAIPQLAIERQGDTSVVYVIHLDGSVQGQTITTGLAGSNGLVEVTSGLLEGDQILRRPPGND